MTFNSLLLLILILSGCGAGDGSTLDENGQPVNINSEQPTTPDDDGAIQANLTSLQEHIFTPICSACHIGANAPHGLTLDTLEHSANNLINVTASSNSSFKRVNPGDKSSSLLYLKVIGDPQAGSRMPLNQPPLSDKAITAIGQWIDNGAVINSNQAPLFITNVQQRTFAERINLEIFFSVDVDKNSLTFSQILLEANNQTLAIKGQLTWTNDRLLTIKLSKPMNTREFTIILNRNEISTIFSKYSQPLDGDHDGLPGGEFTYVATY